MVNLIQGDCLEVLKTMADNSVDAMVTDPPAGINFLQSEFDSDRGGRDAWIEWLTPIMRECLRVLKPGAHALIWALPRTSHWTQTAVENAGFEIREQIISVNAQGFPKGQDVAKAIDNRLGAQREVVGIKKGYSPTPAKNPGGYNGIHSDRVKGAQITLPATDLAKKWEGWHSALKPSAEIWILARKSFDGTLVDNVLTNGTGALNIDACRIEYRSDADRLLATPQGRCTSKGSSAIGAESDAGRALERSEFERPELKGRYPSNFVLSHAPECDETCVEGCPVLELDRQSGYSVTKRIENPSEATMGRVSLKGTFQTNRGARGYTGSGGPSRFFQVFDYAPFIYARKASKSDRNAGLDKPNPHPTVKSLNLMKYLCKLITPPGGTVIDPFMGSGTTGCAALQEGFNFVGIELDEAYYGIAKKRVEHFMKIA